MDHVPVFATTPKVGVANLTTATGATELGTSAPTQAVEVLTAGSNGAFLERFKVKNRDGAPSTGICRLFYFDGTYYWLIAEIALPTGTPSATVLAGDTDWQPLNLKIPAGKKVYATTTVTKNANVILEYQDL